MGRPLAGRFWGQVVSTPTAIRNAARLRERLYSENELTAKYQDQGLIIALVKDKLFEEAENLYDLLSNKRSSSSLIRDGSFQYEPKYPPLDWQFTSSGEFGAAISNGALQLSAISNSGGLFARQLVKLPNAVLEVQTEFDRQIPDTANLFLSIACAEAIDNMPPKKIRYPLSEKFTRFQISNLRSECTYYWVDIVGRSTENNEGFDIGVKTLKISIS